MGRWMIVPLSRPTLYPQHQEWSVKLRHTGTVRRYIDIQTFGRWHLTFAADNQHTALWWVPTVCLTLDERWCWHEIRRKPCLSIKNLHMDARTLFTVYLCITSNKAIPRSVVWRHSSFNHSSFLVDDRLCLIWSSWCIPCRLLPGFAFCE